MPCSICARDDMHQINTALDAGTPYRVLEERYQLGHGTLSRHSQHRQEGPETDDPPVAVTALLTSIRDAIATTYQEQITTAQEELRTAREQRAVTQAQLQDQEAVVDQRAGAASRAREKQGYPPFKRPRDASPRTALYYQLHPRHDVLELALAALQSACEALVLAERAAGGAGGRVHTLESTLRTLEQELVAHRERLDKPESLALARELVALEQTLAALTGVTPAHRQPLIDQTASLWHRLRTGTPPPRRLPEPEGPLPTAPQPGLAMVQHRYQVAMQEARQAATQMDAMIQRYEQGRAALRTGNTPTPACEGES